MKHSSRQLQRENEYADQNREYLQDKRGDLRELRRNERPPEKKKKSNTFCCSFVLILILLAVGLILYFALNVKDDVYKDFINKKMQFEEVLPQGKDEVKKGIEQGEDLFQNTKETLEDVQDKYEKAQEFYDEGKETLEKIQDVKEVVEEAIQ